MSDYYYHSELINAGFSSVGHNVQVHRTVQMYKVSGTLGSNVRIDGPTVITGGLFIGSNVHIGAFCRLAAGDTYIKIGDDSGISSHCSIYAVSEDFLNPVAFGNPTHKNNNQNPVRMTLHIGSKVMLGTGVTLLPGSDLSDRVVISAGTVIRRKIGPNFLVISETTKVKLIPRKLL